MPDLFSQPFIPATGEQGDLPLERFIPPLPQGIVSRWLHESVPKGSWVLDPFCSTPLLSLEAARSGYKVLVTGNNPILNLLLETLAATPKVEDFKAALAELDLEKFGETRLTVFLKSLYFSNCSVCGEQVTVKSFLWQKDSDTPFAKIYTCPNCGDEGEKPTTQTDVEKLKQIGNTALHLSRALSRVNIGDREAFEGAQEALKSYHSRPLFFIFTILNRIDGLRDEHKRSLLRALMLHVLDHGSSLWPWPSSRSRPRQLVIPSQFRENNLWLALEESIQILTNSGDPVKLYRWPEIPQSEGICLYPGRFRSIEKLPATFDIKAVLSVFPRPVQAFWTLSAVWSGWIWGKEAVIPLKSALERTRYDWNWLTAGLIGTYSAIVKTLGRDTSYFGILSELETGFLAAVINALDGSGLKLTGLALRPSEDMAQITWHAPESVPGRKQIHPETEYQQGISSLFNATSEPQSYVSVFSAGLCSMAFEGCLPAAQDGSIVTRLKTIQSTIQNCFNDRLFIYPLEKKSLENENALWLLTNHEKFPPLTLSDRIELQSLQLLQERKAIDYFDLEDLLCKAFPGLTTPSSQLLDEILTSYADSVDNLRGSWNLKPQDTLQKRQNDLRDIKEIVSQIAKSMGFETIVDNSLTWIRSDGTPLYQFFPITTTIISQIINSRTGLPPNRSIILLPGSRSRLLSYKLLQNKHLSLAVEQGWRFVKFRYLHKLAEEKNLTLKRWESVLDLDPPSMDEPTQLSIFSKL